MLGLSSESLIWNSTSDHTWSSILTLLFVSLINVPLSGLLTQCTVCSISKHIGRYVSILKEIKQCVWNCYRSIYISILSISNHIDGFNQKCDLNTIT